MALRTIAQLRSIVPTISLCLLANQRARVAVTFQWQQHMLVLSFLRLLARGESPEQCGDDRPLVGERVVRMEV